MREVHRNILRLALPSVVTNITVPLLGLVDTTIVGHMGRAEYIGAIAIGTTIFNICYWIFAFLRMGTTGLVAQAHGRGDAFQIKFILRRSLSLSLLLGCLLLLAQRFILTLSLWLMPAEAEVQQMVTTYFGICIWGAPPMLALFVLNGWFIGCQDTRSPMLVAIAQNLLNIALSLWLVCGCRWKIEGVATGTLLAQWAAALTALILAWRKSRTMHSTATTATAPLALARVFRIHRDIFLRTLCLVSVTLGFTAAGSRQGNLILSANALLMQFFIFYSYFTDGLANAAEALSGRYAGAGDRPMLRTVVGALFVQSTLVALLFTSVYLVCGPAILRLLTDQPSVAQTARHFLPWAVAIPLLAMPAMVWDGVFIGLTWSTQMMQSMALSAAAFFAVRQLAQPSLGNHALWLAFVGYLLLRGTLQTVYVTRKYIIHEL